MANTSNIPKRRLHHLGWVVRSIEASLPRFQQQFGLQYVGLEETPSVRLAFLQVGESLIELLEPVGEEGTVAAFLATAGEGIHHIAFEVDDVDAGLVDARQCGLRLVTESARHGSRGTRIGFIDPESPDRMLIELVQELAPGHERNT